MAAILEKAQGIGSNEHPLPSGIVTNPIRTVSCRPSPMFGGSYFLNFFDPYTLLEMVGSAFGRKSISVVELENLIPRSYNGEDRGMSDRSVRLPNAYNENERGLQIFVKGEKDVDSRIVWSPLCCVWSGGVSS
jgi:hypothetical protein